MPNQNIPQNETIQPKHVLDFWINAGHEKWFEKNDQFDQDVTHNFKTHLENAKKNLYDHWREKPNGKLALIILLDQFSRNIYRDTPKMFEADEKALQIAKDAIAEGIDMEIPQNLRQWFYLPFMHSENIEDQEKCIELSRKSNLKETEEYAIIHADIIRKFGRFPHRNKILNRKTTQQEQDFLNQGGFAG